MRTSLTVWLFAVLFLAFGCGGNQDTQAGQPVVPPPAPPPQTSSLLLRIALSDENAEATEFRVFVTDPDGFQELLAPVTQSRGTGASQEIELLDVPVGPLTVVVEALDASGHVISSFVQDVELGPTPQTVTVDTFVPKGQTRELGLVSVGANGVLANGPSTSPAISSDGRFVAFASAATNLVTGSHSGSEIFVRDRQLGTLSKVSVDDNGLGLRGTKFEPDISATGRFVVFRTGPATGQGRIFLRNRGRPTVAPNTMLLTGGQLNGQTIAAGSRPRIAGDGSRVAFQTVVNGQSQVVLADANGGLELISVSLAGGFGNGASKNPCLSGDGRFVVFHSLATDVANNGGTGIMLRDRVAQSTVRLAINPALENLNISSDGRFILASGFDRNPFLFDQLAGTGVGIPTNVGVVSAADLSDDGRYIAFYSTRDALIPNDVNGKADLYVFDRQTSLFSRLNVANDSTSVAGGVDQVTPLASPVISGDGKRVAFASDDALLVPGNQNQNLASTRPRCPPTAVSTWAYPVRASCAWTRLPDKSWPG